MKNRNYIFGIVLLLIVAIAIILIYESKEKTKRAQQTLLRNQRLLINSFQQMEELTKEKNFLQEKNHELTTVLKIKNIQRKHKRVKNKSVA